MYLGQPSYNHTNVQRLDLEGKEENLEDLYLLNFFKFLFQPTMVVCF